MGGNRHAVIVAYASLVLSVIATAFTGFQFYDSYRHNIASIQPVLTFIYEPDTHEPIVGLKMENAGLGPARVQSVRYYVDRNPMKDAGEVLQYGNLDKDELIETWDLDQNEPIRAGEAMWLFGRPTKNKKGLDAFSDFIYDHVAVAVTYCSLDGHCEATCSSEGRC